MLRVLGGPKRFCDGFTRRELLQVGSLGLSAGAAGLVSRSRARAGDCAPLGEPAGFWPGQVVHPPLHVRFTQPARDVRPQARAPREIRGELGCIPSSVPGLNVCERLPRLAQVMDKVTLIRSVSHPYPIHGVAFATTGIRGSTLPMELNPRDANHWPFIGSVVDHIDGRRRRRARAGGRRCRATSYCRGRSAASASARWPARGPMAVSWARPTTRSATEFVGRATKTARKTLADKVWEDVEPYRGITPESRFELARSRTCRPS